MLGIVLSLLIFTIIIKIIQNSKKCLFFKIECLNNNIFILILNYIYLCTFFTLQRLVQ